MPYQYVREPLTAEESDRLSNPCETPTERLVVWTLLDTGLRVGELCDLTPKNVLWQQRQLRFKGKSALTVKRSWATTASRRRPSTSTSLTFTSRTSSSGNGENGPSAGCPANWTA